VEPSRVEIVLVRPRRPANVAAACRAMKNMGLARLWLVDARPGWDEPEARALAYGAWDVLDGARQAASLLEAVASSGAVVATSGLEAAGTWSPRRLAEEAGRLAGGRALSLVFGPEDSGLTAAERALCHVVVRIPSAPEQPSLNLAQAVLLLAYELRLAWLAQGAGAARSGDEPRASAGDVEQAVSELGDGLVAVGYLDEQNPAHILAELRGLVTRARPTEREVVLLRGMARQLRWAGGIARSRSDTG